MARLVFGMNQSLDGYVDHMAFAPSPTLFHHFIEEAQAQEAEKIMVTSPRKYRPMFAEATLAYSFRRGGEPVLYYWPTEPEGYRTPSTRTAALNRVVLFVVHFKNRAKKR